MTPKQFQSKFNNMMPDTIETIRRKAQNIVNSGAIDLKGADNNFVLPKLVLKAALLEMADDIALPSGKWNGVIANMRAMAGR